MDIFLKLTDSVFWNKSSPFISVHYVVLYSQNGDRIVTIDSMTSLHPIYNQESQCAAISMREIQEAQLSPSDRAMRAVSSNLANYHATVQKLLI